MAARRKSEGFGFIPAEAGHHFLVTIPLSKSDKVFISEHFSWDESEERRKLSFDLGNEDDKMKVVLPRVKWSAIADAVQEEFNRRLKRNALKTCRWKAGQTPVSRVLGKELVLLAWAIEDADPALIPDAIRNWLGLTPEERWWLFTMTNAATGHAIEGRNKGWRKAVRYVLTENPVTQYPPEQRPDLFLLMEEAGAWGSKKADNTQDKSEASCNDGV